MPTTRSRSRRLAGIPSKADEDLERAKRIAREMQDILESSDTRKNTVERAARRLDITTRHVYTLLNRYKVERTTSSLLRKTGPRSKRIGEKVEEIIAERLRSKWHTKEAPDLNVVVKDIADKCEAAGLSPPSYVTVQDRISVLFSPEEIAKERSSNPNDLRRLKARPGYITARAPLAVWQIDHTPTDISFVEVVDPSGAFVGRANMTFSVDVYSKCIVGFCLTLEKP